MPRIATRQPRIAKGQPEPSLGPTPAQELALAALLAGQTVTAAAAAAGVCREQVTRWKRDDVVFIASYNARVMELREAARAELRALAKDAIAAIRDLVTSADTPPAVRLQAAKDVLHTVGGLGGPESITTDELDPEELLASRIKAERDYARFMTVYADTMPSRVVKPHWTPIQTPPPDGAPEGSIEMVLAGMRHQLDVRAGRLAELYGLPGKNGNGQ